MKRSLYSKRRHGAAIVYATLIFVVLMGAAGLSIDVGNFYLQRDKAQVAADAAALAGALKLAADENKSTADLRAKDIAAGNGFDVAAGATFESVINSDSVHPIRYQVRVTKSMPVFFMAIFGFRHKTVGAQAIAATFKAKYSPYVVPIGITMPDYDMYKFSGTAYSETGHTFTMIRHNKQDLAANDLVLFDLRGNNGKSPKKMQDQLLGLDTPPVTIYDSPIYPAYDVNTCTNTNCEQGLNASGNAQAKFLTDGIDTLIKEAAGPPWFDNTGNNGTDLTAYNDMITGKTDYSNPRVINLIVTDPYGVQNGNSYMPVRAFVPVYVLGYVGDGKNSDLDVTFLFLPTQGNLDPNLETNSKGRTIALVK